MSKFKVGDVIVALGTEFTSDVTVGKHYTVTGVTAAGAVQFLDDVGDERTRHSSWYELVSSAEQADAEFRETTFGPLPTARKDDSGKLDMNLLDDMPRATKAVVEVMQWAIVDKKPVPYVRGSWLGVHADRYRAAIKRHERSAAEQATAFVPARFQRDAETNLLHLAHTACSAMMALENALRELEAE